VAQFNDDIYDPQSLLPNKTPSLAQICRVVTSVGVSVPTNTVTK